jgi:ribose-phosphate pyrophosphokinase
LAIIACRPEFRMLSIKLAEKLRAKQIAIESKIFPDGESYLRFAENFNDGDLVVVQSCFPQQDKRLIELLLTLNAAKELGAKRTIAVVPYLAYARQDKRFRTGEVISNVAVGKLIESVGTDLLVTVDVHNEQSLEPFKTKTINVSAMPLLAEYLKNLKLSRPYILAPDKGAATHARLVASILGTDHTYFEKHRDTITGQVVTTDRELKLEGRDAVILDDMISTGSTIANVAKIVKRKRPRKIIAACTHALLIGDAEENMRKEGVMEIIGTDTVPSSLSKVSVAPAVAESLRQIL